MRAPERYLDPPAPSRAVCVVCGELAYDPQDRESAPWAAAVRDGVVCSPGCALRDRLRVYSAPDDGRNRAAAIREALMEGVDLEELRVTFETDAEGFGLRTVTGYVVEASNFGVTLEGLPPEGNDGYIAWDTVRDAEVITDAG